MKTRISVQERLKDLRVEQGLNLEELAQKTGISKSALGSYENDNDEYKEINHGSLLKLADFYQVSVDYLLGLTNNRRYENTPIEELHLSDEVVELLKSERFNNRLLCEIISHEKFKELHFRQYADIAEAKLKQQTDVIHAQTEAQKVVIDSQAQATKRMQEGYTYQQERGFDVAQDAARNEAAGQFSNMGIGLGMMAGVGGTVGGMVGGVVSDAFTGMGTAQPQTAANKFCDQCGAELTPGAAFCDECGAPQAPSDTCAKCGFKFIKSGKFCPKCGTKREG